MGRYFHELRCARGVQRPASKEVAEWDANLPWYFSDCDYYRRMRLAGWETQDSGLPVEDSPSQTINADPELAFLNSVTFPLYREYYRKKWGGDNGTETFDRPFNRIQVKL